MHYTGLAKARVENHLKLPDVWYEHTNPPIIHMYLSFLQAQGATPFNGSTRGWEINVFSLEARTAATFPTIILNGPKWLE